MSDDDIINWVGDGYPSELRVIVERISPGSPPRLDVGRGWWPLLAKLDASLQHLDPDYAIARVRADAGRLRFDASSGIAQQALDGAIRVAEDEASRTCERCGKRGTRRETARGGIVLCDEHGRPLTDEEVDFAIAGGVPAEAFRTEGHLDGTLCATVARQDPVGPYLTAEQVAAMLHTDVTGVWRMYRQGGLAGAERAGAVVYPEWQFTRAGATLPGLREVLAAFPSDYTSRDVETVMTCPQEELQGRSPLEWLRSGQSAAAVIEFVDELSWS